MKFFIKFRKSIMLLVKAMIIISVTFSFISILTNYYRDAMLYRNGNFLIIFSFILLFVILSSAFKAFRIGIYRTHEIIYYFLIALIFTNLFTYFELSLIAEYLLNPFPIIFGTVFQLAIISVGSICANSIYFILYKARRMLAIFSDEKGFELIEKMGAIPDRFKVEQGVNVNNTSIEEIKRLIDKYECVIICNIAGDIERDIILYCYTNQKRTYLLPSITDIIISNSYAIQISDVPVLMSRNRGLTYEQTILKRITDIVFSLILIILSSPVMIVTAIAVKLQDFGPVFFKQNRITRGGRFFNIIKFRSMIVDADKNIKGIKHTKCDDSRITPVGRIIRRFRIDELPQLFNVLKGDMSLVGPRPENAENVFEYSKKFPEFDLRHRVKAGITGFAQIYGKHNTSPEDKLKMDLIYVENYSYLQDLKLMILTLKTVFTKDSAEGFQEENGNEK